MSLAAKILAGLAVLGVIAIVLVLLLTGEDKVKGDPLWVVVGEDGGNPDAGNIMFSKSGICWADSSDKGASISIAGYGVAYGLDENNNPLWVAVGVNGVGKNAGQIMFSKDGKTWTQSSDKGACFVGGMEGSGFGVAYGLSSDKKTGLWVAVGENNTQAGNILFSTDGQFWEQSDDSGASFRGFGRGVAYGLSSDKTTGLWVATGDNDSAITPTGTCAGNILFSTDGQKWEPSNSSGASFRNFGEGVAYGLSSDKKTGLWVAVGNNFTNFYEKGDGACAGNILFSTDGKKWEQSVESGASFRYQGNGVAYGLSSDKKTGLWVAVGNNFTNFYEEGDGACAGNILFSTDGKKWEQSVESGASFRLSGIGVAYGLDEDNNPLWVACGNNNTPDGGACAGNVLFSRDGQKWQQSDPSGDSFAAAGYGAAFGKILNLALQ